MTKNYLYTSNMTAQELYERYPDAFSYAYTKAMEDGPSSWVDNDASPMTSENFSEEDFITLAEGHGWVFNMDGKYIENVYE